MSLLQACSFATQRLGHSHLPTPLRDCHSHKHQHQAALKPGTGACSRVPEVSYTPHILLGMNQELLHLTEVFEGSLKLPEAEETWMRQGLSSSLEGFVSITTHVHQGGWEESQDLETKGCWG